MQPRVRIGLALLGVVLLAGTGQGADQSASLTRGTPDLQSVGPLAFGPEGILFVGDPKGSAIFAIDSGDRTPTTAAGPVKVEGIDAKIAGMLGTTEKAIRINDMAVNPDSGNAFLSVSRGKGPDAAPAILRVNRDGKIDEVALKDVKFAKVVLSKPATGRNQQDAITKMAFVDGRLFVAGLSNEKFSSRLRAIPFPFKEADDGANVEIFHGSHGRFETNSPIRTFAPYQISGQDHILAAYTCTPLVKIPVAELSPGAKVKGTTVAELGNRNRPLDMIVYQKDGKNFILMANSARGLMKITTDDIGKAEGIKEHVSDKAGLPYETITGIKGIMHLDRLDKENALVLRQAENGTLNLETMALP